MNITKILSIASLLLGITGTIANAATINVTPYSEARFDSYGANVGISGPDNIIPNGNTLTGLIGDSPGSGGINQEYRTIWQFDLFSLGITAGDVVSATVNWTGSAIWGGTALGIDVVNSDFTTWNTIPMYGGAVSAITSGQNNNGSGSTDLTSAFQFALTNATATSGLALRFYTAGNPGDYVAGNISNVNIDVVTVPEPSTVAFLVVGGLITLTAVRRMRVRA
ncbi:MAG: hypothetical protein ACOYMS_07635 [Terrimicrobiaceae bacterium]